MESYTAAIVLGVVQGLTEFLPVSSSGHLVLAQAFIPGFSGPPAAFDVLLHGGTLIAVLAYFRQDVLKMAAGLKRPREGGLNLPLLLVAGTVPAGIVGGFFKDRIEILFHAPAVASAGLVVTGLLLLLATRVKGGSRKIARMGYSAAILIGAFQAAAIVPGISRSGATICAALFLGYSGTESARFSFLLSMPAVAGALALEAGDLAAVGSVGPYAAGAAAAAVTGWLSIAVLMRVMADRKLFPFAAYCLVLGSLSSVFLVFF